MKYVEQSLKDLKMNIIMGEFDISNLSIMEEKTILFDNLKIRAAVIGASHAITFTDVTSGEVVFTEIIANVNIEKDFPETKTKINFSNIIKTNMKNFSFKKFKKNNFTYDYDINFKKMNMYNNEDIYTNFDLLKNNQILLDFSFLKKDPSQKLDSKTIVIVKIKKNNFGDTVIFIETIHVYPNESKALKTETRVIQKKVKTMKEKIMIDASELIQRIKNKSNKQVFSEKEIIDIIYDMKKDDKNETVKNSSQSSNEENQYSKDEFLEDLKDMTDKVTEEISKNLNSLNKEIEKKISKTKDNLNSKEVQESFSKVKEDFSDLINNLIKK